MFLSKIILVFRTNRRLALESFRMGKDERNDYWPQPEPSAQLFFTNTLCCYCALEPLAIETCPAAKNKMEFPVICLPSSVSFKLFRRAKLHHGTSESLSSALEKSVLYQ